MWDTACPDWQERILDCRSLVPDLPLFKTEAERALRIFKRLKLPDVIGTPTMAEACGEWFFPVVEAIFGSYDPSTDRRMIQEFFQLIPKKNSKSSNGGAVMVTALIVNRRPQAEFLLIAPTMEIANIAFKQAKGTILADAALAKLFRIQQHIRTITHLTSGATLQIKAADTDVITGSKSTGIMIDETHVFAQRSNAQDVFVEIRGALAARPDGFLFQTTTQSKKPPAGVFRAELSIARKVRDGQMKLPLLPILYELPTRISDDGGWKDKRYWAAVNPNMNRSVNIAFLENELLKAEDEGPEKLALIASQHFNVEIGLALRADRWPGADFWQQAADEAISLETLIERCDCATMGIDGGGLDDLFGLAVLGRERETRNWLLWTHTWCHAVVLDRRKSEAPALRDFEAAGDLTIIAKVGEDIDGIVEIARRLNAAGILATIGMDPVGIGAVVDALEAADMGGDDRIKGVSQGYKLMGAIKTAERKLSDTTLWHAGQSIMAYCVGNARKEPKGNAELITKQASGTGKIDTLMASFDAIALMSMNPEPVKTRSVYEDRGLRVA